MATRRTTIEIQVLNLADLQAANSALNTHVRAIQRLTSAYTGLNAVTGALPLKLQSITNDFRTYNTTIDKSVSTTNNFKSSLNNANTAGSNFLVTMLKYKAVGFVFSEVQKAIGAAVEAMKELEKQAARVQRVSPPGSTPGIRLSIAEEIARTGQNTDVVGEAFYQLKQQVRDNATAFSALQTAMNLVVGTEADARQTTRAMLQIYAQFGSQLDKTAGDAENFRRIGELLALTWKGADAEMVDITNSLKYLGPIAEASGVKLEQVMGTIAALTAEGHRGRMSGTEAAQFLVQMLKNYDQAIQGIKSKTDGGVWHFKLAIDTKTGGVDLQQTIKNIVDTANRLPVDQARKFLLEISGSTNSFRFLGTTGAEFMKLLDDRIRDATKALQGQTAEAEKLQKTMTTTAVEFDRLWKGAFNTLGALVDASPLRGFLRGVADDVNHIAEGLRIIQQLQGGAENFARNTLANSDRPAVEMTQQTVRQALANLRASHNAPTFSQLTAGSQLDIATRGMTQAERDMIRHRYLPSGDTLRNLDEHAMENDLATMLRQLANPRFGVPAAGGLSFSDRARGDQSRLNAQLLADLRQASDELHMTLQIGTAISGHSERTTSGNRSRHTMGQAVDITSLGGVTYGSDPAQFTQKARSLQSWLTAHGYAQSEGGNDASVLFGFNDPARGGNHLNHLHVSRRAAGTRTGLDANGNPIFTPGEDKKAQREADAADRALAEAKDKYARLMQAEYERAVKRFGADDARSIKAAKIADDAAAAAGDEVERYRLKHGLTGNVAGNRDAAIKEREDRADKAEKDRDLAADAAERRMKAAAATAKADYDIAFKVHGAYSPYTSAAAKSAAAMEIAATADTAERRRLESGVGGVGGEFRDKLNEAMESWFGLAPGVPSASGIQNRYARDLEQKTAASMRARQLGLPTTDLFGDQASAQSAALRADAADYERERAALVKMGIATVEVQKRLEALDIAIEDNTAAQRRLGEEAAAKAQSRLFSDAADKYGRRLSDIENANLPVVGETQRQAEVRERDLLLRKLDYANQHYAEMSGLSALNSSFLFGGIETEQAKKAREDADVERKRADLAVQRYDRQTAAQRYASVHDPLADQARGYALDALHGQGNVGQFAEGIGGAIVNAALEPWVKRFTDPLVQTVTKEILALQESTQAIGTLTDTLSGTGQGTFTGGIRQQGGELGKVIGVGLALGASYAASTGLQDFGWGPVGAPSGGGKSRRSGSGRMSDLEKGVGAGLAAYSIGATSAAQGVNAGNFLGGVLSGASIGSTFGPGGGLIGGLLGGAVDLIGGLFHHRSKPTAEPRDLNPALYNAPAGFDIAAYHYSLLGKLPTLADVGFDVKPQVPPTFNVFIDGAKSAARVEINRQAANINVSLNNTVMDRYRPV